MPTQDEIAHQQNMLSIYRRNLKHLVRQAGHFGSEDEAPVHIANSLKEARDNIQRIKGILRGWSVAVTDDPDDEPPGAQSQPSVPAPPSSARSDTTEPRAKDPQFEYDVFISYSHADEQWVEQVLLKRLEDAGLRVCIDFRDFIPGKPAIVNMQDAATQSRHTVLVLTDAWIKSEWTLFESLLTRTSDPAGLRRRTVPLRLHKVDLPDFISMLTWVDFTRPEREDSAWRQLLKALEAPIA